MEKLHMITDQELNEKYSDWISFFDRSDKAPMSKDLTEIVTSLNIMDEESFKMRKENYNFSFALARKRSDFIHLSINAPAILLITMLTNGLPPRIIMYYLKYWQICHDETPITVPILLNIFPSGFPTENCLNILWNTQKIRGFNLLDIIEHDFETI